MKFNIKWLFFDIGSTLVDESLCYEERYRIITLGTSISCEEFRERVLFYSRMNCNHIFTQAIAILVTRHRNYGEFEKAFSYARRMPGLQQLQDFLLTEATDGKA